jgi:hypothetical protein
MDVMSIINSSESQSSIHGNLNNNQQHGSDTKKLHQSAALTQ